MRLVPVVAALAFMTASAVAQPAPDMPPPGGQVAPPHMNLRQRFEAANVTHDGRLTQDQAAAAGMRGIAAHFDAVDVDHKGYVTLQDLRAFQQARRQARAAQQKPPQQEQPPQR